MEYTAAYHTDVGITKKTNQDSLAVKIVDTPEGQVAFAIVCDGMGGLAKGELASKEVIEAFCAWFDEEFLENILTGSFDEGVLIEQWNDIIQKQNRRLAMYGEKNKLQLGTTISAILMLRNEYYIVHVGDSRVYHLTDRLIQLTKDQTLIQREMDAGRLTPEQARTDPRRSILLQCVGASPVVEPEFTKGDIEKDTVYMICSDGFRHQISEDEIMQKLGPEAADSEKQMKMGCAFLTELVKERRETDNITVLCVKTK